MKLVGINVLDISTTTAAARVTTQLADHGADVLLIEQGEDGHPLRKLGTEMFDSHSVRFRNLARGKRSARLNLHDPKDHDWFLTLAKQADIIVYGSDGEDDLSTTIDYTLLKQANSRLIFCALTPFGHRQETARSRGLDLDIQALTGVLAARTDIHLSAPVTAMESASLPIADIAGAMTALSAILMALHRRHESGEGEYIDIALYDSLLSWMEPLTEPIFSHVHTSLSRKALQVDDDPFYKIYRTRDARHIVLSETRPVVAERLLTALGREDLSEALTETPEDQQTLRAFLIDVFARKTHKDWADFLNVLDVNWSPIRSLQDAFDDPLTRERKMVLKDGEGYSHIGTPIKFASEPGRINFEIPDFAGLENEEEENNWP